MLLFKITLFKYIAFLLLLTTFLFSETSLNEELHEKLLESRLENYEKDLNIKNLESKMAELKNDFEKLKETQDTYRIEKNTYDYKMENHTNLINTQDQRINDINLYLAFWGALITVILIVVFFKSKDEAKEVAKDTAQEFIDKWIEKKAMPIFNEKIDNAIDVEISEYIGPKIEKIEAFLKDIELHKSQVKDHANEMDQLMQEAKKQLGTISKDEVKEIEAKDDRKVTAQEHLTLGVDALNELKYNTALNEFQAAVRLADEDSEELENSLTGQGMVLEVLHEYNLAIASYKKVLDINPNRDYIYDSLGDIYIIKKEYDKAFKFYQRAIEINPYASDTYEKLFELALMQNKEFHSTLEKQFIKSFKSTKDNFIKYEALKILQNILSNKAVDLDSWQKTYRNVTLSLWNIDKLYEWTDTIKDKSIKVKVLEALEVFKSHKKA